MGREERDAGDRQYPLSGKRRGPLVAGGSEEAGQGWQGKH